MKTITATLAVALLSGGASAGTLAIPFTAGSGNSNTNFAISTATEASGKFAGNTVELGLKGKQRFLGDTLLTVGNLYHAEPGFSPTSGGDMTPDPTRAWWNFDFSIDLGTRTAFNTSIDLTLTDIEGDVFTFPLGLLGLGGNSIIQDSWNIGFGYISTPLNGFDPFKNGDYHIEIVAKDSTTGDTLAGVDIVVRVGNVIPLPTPAFMGATGLIALAGIRRRRD